MRLLLLTLPALLIAAESRPSLLERMARPQFSLQSDWLAASKIEGSEGSVRTSKQRLRVSTGFGGLAYTRWYFHWNDEQTLPFYRGKAPIEQMQRVKAYGNYYRRLSPEWSTLVMLNLNATFEKELDGDALGAGVLGFFSYRLDGDHSVQMGAFANYHPVTTLALPALGYSYRARADDGLQMVLGFPRAYIGYHAAPGWLVRTGFVYSQAVIRLSEHSGIEPAGYAEASDYQASAGVRTTFKKQWELSADLLYAFRRDMDIYDRRARRIDSYRIKPSPGAMLKLTYAFH
jgi:hypothetical protein